MTADPQIENLGPLSEEAAAPPADPSPKEKDNPLDTGDEPLTEATAPPPIEDEPAQRNLWQETPNVQIPSLSIDSPDRKPRKPPTRHATLLYTLSYLIFFAIFGTLARLGLQALTFYPGAPVVTGVLWSNVAGSLIMGFLLEDRQLFAEEWGDDLNPTNNNNNNNNNNNANGNNTPEEHSPDEHEEHERDKRHKAVKKTIPLYIGLTTGFCGCFTSFSSFMRDVFLALTNDLPNPSTSTIAPRNGGYSFMALIAVIITTVSLCISALICGAHLALAFDKVSVTPTLPFRFMRKFLDPLIVFLAWGCWLGAIFLAIWPPDRHSPQQERNQNWRGRAVFGIVFAPLGCLLRFYLSLYLNARIPSFPLGTFTVNIFGTAILGMCFDLQHVDGIGASASTASPSFSSASILVSCQVLQGVMDGFCGSATTVSTWVAELNGLRRRRDAYVYGVGSVAVALGFLVVIMGSLGWTVGFVRPVCQ